MELTPLRRPPYVAAPSTRASARAEGKATREASADREAVSGSFGFSGDRPTGQSARPTAWSGSSDHGGGPRGSCPAIGFGRTQGSYRVGESRTGPGGTSVSTGEGRYRPRGSAGNRGLTGSEPDRPACGTTSVEPDAGWGNRKVALRQRDEGFGRSPRACSTGFGPMSGSSRRWPSRGWHDQLRLGEQPGGSTRKAGVSANVARDWGSRKDASEFCRESARKGVAPDEQENPERATLRRRSLGVLPLRPRTTVRRLRPAGVFCRQPNRCTAAGLPRSLAQPRSRW